MRHSDDSPGRARGLFRLDSIRKKILAFAVGATLVPSLFTAVVYYTQTERAMTDRLQEELRGASLQAAHTADFWLGGSASDLRAVASSYEVSENVARHDPRGATRLTEYLSSIQRRIPDYATLAAYDPAGRKLAAVGRQPDPDVLPAGWAAQLTPGGALFGAPADSELPLAVPVPTITGRVVGVMLARLDLAGLRAQLAELPRRPGLRLTLVDSAGVVHLATDSLPPDTAPAYAVEALAALRDTVGLASYAGRGGEPIAGAASPLITVPLTVVAELPSREAFALLSRTRAVTSGIIIGLLAVISGIAYLFGLVLVRPLDRLIAGATEVAAGNLDVDLPVTTDDEVGALTAAFNSMVTRLREGRNDLERLSLTDALTGLYNRRHLGLVLATECERARRHKHPACLLLIDIDHFKRYNDSHGHLAGDEVLRRVAQLIMETVRTGDCAARYGGEEFAVVLPETAVEGAMLLAERLRRRIALEGFQGGAVTLSIGVGQAAAAGSTPDSITAAADEALYRAKREGRDRVRA